MKRSCLIAAIFVLGALFGGWLVHRSGTRGSSDLAVRVCFSPRLGDGCSPTSAIVKQLSAAKHIVLVQAYAFTSRPIAQALIDAQTRGVQVRVILDEDSTCRMPSVPALLIQSSINTSLDDSTGLAHNKVMIIDDGIVVTGSFNFTNQAEFKNAENLVIIKSSAIATEYTQNWLRQAQFWSTPYVNSTVSCRR